MGNCRAKPIKLSGEETNELCHQTGFTRAQIHRLHERFYHLDKRGQGFLERDDFFEIPDLEINPLSDRIIDAFFAEVYTLPWSQTPKVLSQLRLSEILIQSGNIMKLRLFSPQNTSFRRDPEKGMSLTEFANVLAHFRPCKEPMKDTINSREQKLKFAFAMYDLNKNGFITRYEFKIILTMMIGPSIDAEQLESITDRTITEGDYEKNGKISFDEFCRVILPPLLDEISDTAVRSF
ncbi:unnamed protein product [Anisakis simplex]|uniref:Calcineurin B homologous protein 3 (inferred by orthology to a human protein) n=1 Tax=Anisakis simplex TaxID=6269 RepID=A0A0M3JSG1_ANISI|nr:unnamed protein product [Anisakis simplex]